MVRKTKAASGASDNLVALGLTTRQAEIMGWLLLGKTDSEIAAILAVSPRTISHTLARIYRKLGVHNRVAAATRVIRSS